MSNVPSQCLSWSWWSWHLECMELERKAGYATALDAAREALAGLDSSGLIYEADALAAIDALRGES